MIKTLTWEDIDGAALLLASRQKPMKHTAVWGVPTGGSVIAPFVARHLGIPVAPLASLASLIVDDLVDSGATLRRVALERDRGEMGMPAMVDALYRKPHAPAHIARNAVEIEGWLHFPWEKAAQPEDAVVRLLEFLGEDPNRDGLRETPSRVCKALREMTEGVGQDVGAILSKRFELSHDELVLIKDIPFTSLCEHHMLPFSGIAHVAYVPSGGKVVGLSKLARLVQCFAKRLQVQERMTGQIADAVQEHLEPLGSACIVSAEHSCLACRGARLPGVSFVTSALRGVLKGDSSARAELMALIGGK